MKRPREVGMPEWRDYMRSKTPPEGSVPQEGPGDIPFTEAIRKALVRGAPPSLGSEEASSAG